MLIFFNNDLNFKKLRISCNKLPRSELISTFSHTKFKYFILKLKKLYFSR